ncbi:MAG: EAL domain-containing protein [Rhodocyclaceae bacterium]|nr:EAL domain-containing protein [Rhodocyclaceae bacterium]
MRTHPPHWRRLAVLLLTLWAWAIQPAWAASGDPLRIGVLAFRGKEKALKDWQPHADYLSERLAPRKFTIVPLTLAEFRPAVEAGEIDLVITNTGHYVELETTGKVARIATMRMAGPHGPVDRFGGVAIALSSRQDLKGYADLRGQRLMVPDKTSFGGWQMHLPVARAAGIDLERDPRAIIEVQNQEKVVAGILAGEADVGFVRDDLPDALIAAGKLAPDALRILDARQTPHYPYRHSTALYPHWPFARLAHVPDELAHKLLTALLELSPQHPAARAAGIYGWTLPHNYQPVHDLFLEFRLGPYANLPVRLSDLMGRYGVTIVTTGLVTITLLLGALWVVLRVNRLLRQSKQQLQLAAGVFKHAQEGIIITDAAANIVDVNDTFLGLTGYRREEVLGKNPRFLSSGRQDKAFYREMWATLLDKGFWRGEMWNRRKDGSFYVQQTSISAVRAESGEITHYIGLSSDISELKESQQMLERMAYFDALTGLPNRRMLTDRLQQAMAHTLRSERLLAVCYLDLDGFKPINDTWGHATGDRILIEAAQRLEKCVRAGDTVSRLGGDEFVLLLTDLAHLEECERILDRVRHELAAPYTLPEGTAQMSASIGVTLFPLDGADVDGLIRHADQAMYASKQSGRNRITLFDVGQDRASAAKRQSREEIARAIDEDELVLHYQPKVDMRSGRVVGVEALVRWQHPERGLLRPADFLPVVEFVGMEEALDDWVLENALAQMARWQAAGIDLAMSVNLCARRLQSADFVAALEALLKRHPGVPAPQLELEILESAALEDLTQVAEVMARCHGLGVRFAIDDFGTGYSSLTYLKQLQASTLKIDQSFIRDMLEDPEDLAIVDGIIGLASAFRREVVAEGVETLEHGRMLLLLGCSIAQGFAIARPMPAEEFIVWLRNWQPPAAWQGIAPGPRWRDVSTGVEHDELLARLADLRRAAGLPAEGGAFSSIIAPSRSGSPP